MSENNFKILEVGKNVGKFLLRQSVKMSENIRNYVRNVRHKLLIRQKFKNVRIEPRKCKNVRNFFWYKNVIKTHIFVSKSKKPDCKNYKIL